MTSYVYGDPFAPQEFRDVDTGLRPSFQELLSAIDMDDPTWPAAAAVLREMAEAGIEIDRAALAIASKLGAHRLANLDEVKIHGRKAPRDPWGMAAIGSIVYYIRRGPVIKIGWTGGPWARFLDLLPDEILAFEPGGVKEETFRHRQFAHLRCQGEHFRPEPELMEHIRLVREANGEPHPDWPTIASMAKSKNIRADLTPLTSEEKMTAAEACARLGIDVKEMRGWIRRRKISAAGFDDHGEQLFYVEHLKGLRDNWRLASS